MASANETGQTEATAQAQPAGGRAQNGGNGGGRKAGQQVQDRETRQAGEAGRALGRPRGRRDLALSTSNPFELMWQLSREMDRMMSAAFTGNAPLFGSNFRSMLQRGRDEDWGALWSPRVDVEQRGDSIVVRADLPGVRKDDIQIDVTDEGLTLSGERREEREERDEAEGFRAIERSYGSFYRAIPLPQKANLEQLKAKMRDGVLEITVPIDESARPRRIQIED